MCRIGGKVSMMKMIDAGKRRRTPAQAIEFSFEIVH
jgi:hypothetical protein